MIQRIIKYRSTLNTFIEFDSIAKVIEFEKRYSVFYNLLSELKTLCESNREVNKKELEKLFIKAKDAFCDYMNKTCCYTKKDKDKFIESCELNSDKLKYIIYSFGFSDDKEETIVGTVFYYILKFYFE